MRLCAVAVAAISCSILQGCWLVDGLNAVSTMRQQSRVKAGSECSGGSEYSRARAVQVRVQRSALQASLWEEFSASVSQRSASKRKYPLDNAHSERAKAYLQLVTFTRVGLPSVLAGILATLVFPLLALSMATAFNDAGVFAVLSQDSSQFVQNFLTVAGLLFSILVGQTYYFMYQQQEAVYYSLFNEVTEAKSLLEQVALVGQGRSMYTQMLQFIEKYVTYDLKQLQCDPAVLLSARPVDDPLESIMYMTSVGVPSIVYETVKSLRQARAARLGALQRKLPKVHMLLLWILAAIELVSFPLLGAGTQTIGGYNILTVEGCLFGVMTFGIVMTLRVVGELWRPAGGAYNVDSVLCVMVSGLEEELQARMKGKTYAADRNYPLPQFSAGTLGGVGSETNMKSLEQQGQLSAPMPDNENASSKEWVSNSGKGTVRQQGGSFSALWDTCRSISSIVQKVMASTPSRRRRRRKLKSITLPRKLRDP